MPKKTTTETASRKGAEKDKDAVHLPLTTDARFAHLHNDPRFIRPKKKDTKVTIDKRFAHMLADNDFAAAPKVDKYGRKIKSSSAAGELKRFYQVEEEEEEETNQDEKPMEDSDESSQEKNVRTTDEKKSLDEEENEEDLSKSGSGSDDSEDESDDSAEGVEVSDANDEPRYDFSRGEGLVSSSNEDSESEDDDNEDDLDDQSQIFEDQDDVPRGDETKRFAVMNLDWDKIKSIDLYIVFTGFKPSAGAINSVRIYPSEFGKERLAKEDREGPPKDIFKAAEESDDEDVLSQDGEDDFIKEDDGNEFDTVKLRKYQLERLRYFYAVVECDAVQTASAIYRACDGTEYESSANFFDLRFIPDDMTFEESPRDAATGVPENYRPREFSTDVLQHSSVKLTWDDDDVDRVAVTRRPISKDELKNMDFSAYLASSEDEADDSDDDIEVTRKKYRALVAGIRGGEDAGDNAEDAELKEGEMEITFAPGLSEAASAPLKKKEEAKTQENETSLETYKRKQKERKLRKQEQRSGAAAAGSDDEQAISDDDREIDMTDPYFAEERGEAASGAKKEVRRDKKKKGHKLTEEEKSEADRRRQELELLLTSDRQDTTGAPAADHFSLKDVIKSEKNKRKKKRSDRRLEETAETQDTFEIDVGDDRFAALHDSHHFAIDPTHPAYKKTNAMQKLVAERQKVQRGKTDLDEAAASDKKKQTPVATKESGDGRNGGGKVKDASLSKLVDAVKRKSSSFTANSQSGKRRRNEN